MQAQAKLNTPLSEKQSPKSYLRIEGILERAEPHLKYPCPEGFVHRAFFTNELHWLQAGARISEMNDRGWKIESVDLPESQWVDGIYTAYRLLSKPLHGYRPNPVSDWRSRLRVATDNQGLPLQLPDAGPLFGGSAA